MTETKLERWERKVEFVAMQLASADGHTWGRLPGRSKWLASKERYIRRAKTACGAANLWDMMNDYREAEAVA